MSNKFRKRRPGSCRFSDYFEVQFYDESTLAWRTIHKPYKTMGEAEAHFVAGKKCRVMKVTEQGRSIVEG